MVNQIKKVLILGLGAIGSIYATKIFDYNPNYIKVLVDKTRLQRYKQNGIVYNNKRYDFCYITDKEINYKPDLIIIATKSTTFNQALNMLNNFITNDTIILSLLNGISSENLLMNKFPMAKVLYSYYVGHSSMKSNNIIQYDKIGIIRFGEKENFELSNNVHLVKSFFDEIATINYEIPQNMSSALWEKFVINIGINQTLAVTNLPYLGFKNKCVREIATKLMSEAIEIAKAIGIKNCDKFINTTFQLIDSMPDNCMPSMLQDIRNKKQNEVDIFAGEICRLGKKLGIKTPYNNLVLNILTAINQNLL